MVGHGACALALGVRMDNATKLIEAIRMTVIRSSNSLLSEIWQVDAGSARHPKAPFRLTIRLQHL